MASFRHFSWWVKIAALFLLSLLVVLLHSTRTFCATTHVLPPSDRFVPHNHIRSAPFARNSSSPPPPPPPPPSLHTLSHYTALPLLSPLSGQSFFRLAEPLVLALRFFLCDTATSVFDVETSKHQFSYDCFLCVLYSSFSRCRCTFAASYPPSSAAPHLLPPSRFSAIPSTRLHIWLTKHSSLSAFDIRLVIPASAAVIALPSAPVCTVTTVAGADNVPGSVDGEPDLTRFNQPMGISYDPMMDTFFVANHAGNRLARYHRSTRMIETVFEGPGHVDGAIAGAKAQGIYNIARLPGDNQRFVFGDGRPVLRLYDVESKTVSFIAGSTGVVSADGVGAAGRFRWISAVTALRAEPDRVVVTDHLHDCLRSVTISTQSVTTLSGLCATPGYSLSPGTVGRWDGPFDPSEARHDGALYVPEMTNRVVRLMDAATGASSLVAGTPGAPAMIVDGPALTTARFHYPATCRTSRDVLFIAEGEFSAVRALHFSTMYVITLVSHHRGATDGAAPSIARMWKPHFADLDCDGVLYLTEYERHTVRKLQCSWPSGEDTANLLPQCAVKRREPTFECTVGRMGEVDVTGSAMGDYHDSRWMFPYGMAHDPGSNELHVADYLNFTMSTAHLSGRFVLRAFGGPTMDNGAFATAGAERIYDLAKIPGHDHRFLAVNNDNTQPSVRLIDTTAKTVAFIAGGSVGFSDGVGVAASFRRVSSITFFREDPSIAFIPDHGAQCIRSVVIATGTVSTPSGICSAAASNAGYNPAAGTSARWWHPFEMGQANGTRRLYVADGFNYVIRLWDTVSGLSPAIAGKVGVADTADGPAMVTARFRRPVALSVASDVVYIGDTWHGIRALLLSDDYVVTLSGNRPILSKDGALPGVGRLKIDHFHEVDCEGNLYVSDYESHVVRTVQCKWPGRTAHSEAHGCDVRRQRDAFQFQCEVSTVGKIGVAGKQGGKFDTMRWDAPFGMAFDPATDELLTVAITNNALFSVHIPSQFAQILVEGSNQTNGPWAGSDPAGMQRPYNIHKISGYDHRFLIISNDNGAPQLRLVDTAAKTVSFIAGSTVGHADGIGAAAQFRRTSDILVLLEDLDVAYIPDHGAECIRRVQLSTGAVTTSSGTCGTGAGYNPAAGAPAKWGHPFEISQANGTRRMYVADIHNYVIRLYDTVSGLSPSIAGQVGVSHLSDGPASIATFVRPTSVSVTPDVLYIGDREGGVRALILAHDYVVSLTAIAPAAAYPDITATSRDGALPHTGRIRINHFQELDCDGNLYVSDYESEVMRIVKCQWPGSLDVRGVHVGCAERRHKPVFQCEVSTVGKLGEIGWVTGEYSDTRFYSPFGMAYDPGTDELLIADIHNNALAAAHVAGQYTTVVVEGDSQTNGAFGTAGMQKPYNVKKIPGHDHRFLTISNDNGAPQLRLVDTAAKTVSFIAGSTVGYADGIGAAAQFYRTSTTVVLVEDLDVAYIPDHGNNCIRRVQLSTGAVTTSSGTCAVGVGFVTSAGAAARWYTPFEAVQANGTRRMYVADIRNRVIRLYDTVSGLSPAIAGIVGDDKAKDGPAHIAAFNAPAALAVTKDIVYIGDTRRGLRALILRTDYVVSLTGPSTKSVWPGTAEESLDGALPHIGRIRINHFHEVDCDGTLFLSDYESNAMRIVKCTWPGLDTNATHVGCAERQDRVQPTCSIGSIGKIDDRATTPVTGSWEATRLNYPFGMAHDPMTGTLHIADIEGNTVVEAHIAAKTTRALITGPTNTEGVFASAGALRPYDVAKVPGASRYLMTTEGANIRLRTYDMETGMTAFLAGGVRAVGAVTDGAGAAATFDRVTGFRFMRENPDVAYGTDHNAHSVRRVQLSTAMITTVSGNGILGYNPGAGTTGQWAWPFQMIQSFDALKFYAADTNNYVVRLFNTVDTTSPPCIGQPGQRQRVDGPATTTARLMHPVSLSITTDVLYIGEVSNGLRALLIAADYVITLAPVGKHGITSQDGALGYPGRLRTVHFSEIDCDGGLYLSDYNSNVVRTVTCTWPASVSLANPEPSCAVKAIAPAFHCTLGTVGNGVAADLDGPFATAQFYNPMGVAFDPFWGSLLHTSWSGHAVRQVDVRSGEVKTLYSGTNTNTGAFSASGAYRVYNAQRLPGDGHHRFLVTHAEGNPLVRLVDVSARTTEHLAGSTIGTNDGVGAAAKFSRPTCAVFLGNDATQAIIVDDTGNCIRRLVLATKTVTTISGVCGTNGFNLGPGTTARWRGPFESAQANGTGRIYVPEMTNRVVRLLDVSDGSSVVVAGKAGVEERIDGPATSIARFEYPGTVSVTKDVVYIGEGMRPHLRALILSLDYVVTIVTGGAGSVDGVAPGPARLYTPHFMDIDCEGRLWIGDFLANRIRTVECRWPGIDANATNPSCPSNVSDRTATDTQSPSSTNAHSATSTAHMTASASSMFTNTATAARTDTISVTRTLSSSVLMSPSVSVLHTASLSSTTTRSWTGAQTATVSTLPSSTQSHEQTLTATLRVTSSASRAPTSTMSRPVSDTVSRPRSASATLTATLAPTVTVTVHHSISASASKTLTATMQHTISSSLRRTATPSLLPTATTTLDHTRSDTSTASLLGTQSASIIATRSATATVSKSGWTQSASALRTRSSTLASTVTPTQLPSFSMSLSHTVSLRATASVTVVPTRSVSPTPTSTATPAVSASVSTKATASTSRTTTASSLPSPTTTLLSTPTWTRDLTSSRTIGHTASVSTTSTRSGTHERTSSMSAVGTATTTASPSSSVRPTRTATTVHTQTVTNTQTVTSTLRPTASMTVHSTPSPGRLPTQTATAIRTATQQWTRTASMTHSSTQPYPSSTATAAVSRSVSIPATASTTVAHSASSTALFSASATNAATVTASIRRSFSATVARTETITRTATSSLSSTGSLALPRTASVTTTTSRTDTKSATASMSRSVQATPSGLSSTASPSASPSATPRVLPTPTHTNPSTATRTTALTSSRSSLVTGSSSALVTTTASSKSTKTTTVYGTATRTMSAVSSHTTTKAPIATRSISTSHALSSSRTLTRSERPSLTATSNGTLSHAPTVSKSRNSTASLAASKTGTQDLTATRPTTPTSAMTATVAKTTTAELSKTASQHATASRSVHPASITATATRRGPSATPTAGALPATRTRSLSISGLVVPTPSETATATQTLAVSSTLVPLVVPPLSPPPVRRTLRGAFAQLFGPDGQCPELSIMASAVVLVPALAVFIHVVIFAIARRRSLHGEELHFSGPPSDSLPKQEPKPLGDVRTGSDTDTSVAPVTNESTRPTGTTSLSRAGEGSTFADGGGSPASVDLMWWQFGLVEHAWTGLFYFPTTGAFRRGYGIPQAVVWAARAPVLAAATAVLVGSSFGQWSGVGPAVLFGFAAAGAATALQPLLSWGWRASVVVVGMELRGAPILDRGPQDLVVFGVPRYRQTIGVSKATYDRLDGLDVVCEDGQDPAPPTTVFGGAVASYADHRDSDPPSGDGASSAPELATSASFSGSTGRYIPTAAGITTTGGGASADDDYGDEVIVGCDADPTADHTIDVVPAAPAKNRSGWSRSRSSGTVTGSSSLRKWRASSRSTSTHAATLFLRDRCHTLHDHSVVREPPRTVASRLGVAVASAAAALCFLVSIIAAVVWAAPWCVADDHHRWGAFHASIVAAVVCDVLFMQPLHCALRALHAWLIAEEGSVTEEQPQLALRYPFQWEGVTVWSPASSGPRKKSWLSVM